MLGVVNQGADSNLSVQRYANASFDGQAFLTAPDSLTLGHWRHNAVVAGRDFNKLYIDGVQLVDQESSSSWKPPRLPALKNFLGRSVVRGVLNAGGDPDYNGQMAEIRLWAGERSAGQVLSTTGHARCRYGRL